MGKRLTDRGVQGFKARAVRYAKADPELRGHWIRVQPTGAKTFAVIARNPAGKQVWHTIAPCDVIGIEEARTRARDALQRIRAGLPAVEPAPTKADTFAAVAAARSRERFGRRHLPRVETKP